MSVFYNVPMVTQQLQYECWYVAAMMVAFYRRPGPRLGMPEIHADNLGLQVADFPRLAEAEGLKPVLSPVANLTPQQLEIFLRTCGPLWCAGDWDGPGHAIVVTGFDGRIVDINDPDPARRRRRETLAWFNQHLWRFPYCLMYMPA